MKQQLKEQDEKDIAVKEAGTKMGQLIANAPTLEEAMKKLEDRELGIISVIDTAINVQVCHEDYALIDGGWADGAGRYGRVRVQGIHPYGSSIAYYLFDRRIREMFESVRVERRNRGL